MVLLDTDTCIDILRAEPAVLERFAALLGKTAFLSSISYHELRYGALHSSSPERHLLALATFLEPLQVLPFTVTSARVSAEISEELTRKGKRIGPLDTLIAGHAREHALTLITGNTQEFGRVLGLRLEDWRG
ncbi:MAG: PIN domain-containing protein [Verrucomicrobiota bacterium]